MSTPPSPPPASADSLRAKGAALGPLHGVPVTIKDWIDVAGLPCTGGDPEFRDRVPSEDASVVSRLRSAGAIVLGKTNVMSRQRGIRAHIQSPRPDQVPGR